MLKELFDFLSPETSITDFGAFVNDFIPLSQRLSIFYLKVRPLSHLSFSGPRGRPKWSGAYPTGHHQANLGEGCRGQ